jgi:uncharacterized membrane protein
MFMSDKLKAIIAHVTLIGWIIAIVLNLSNKTPLTSFYLRQMMGILLLGLLFNLFSGVISMVLSILLIGLWVYSLLGAFAEEKRELPYIGTYFQQWFTFL